MPFSEYAVQMSRSASKLKGNIQLVNCTATFVGLEQLIVYGSQYHYFQHPFLFEFKQERNTTA